MASKTTVVFCFRSAPRASASRVRKLRRLLAQGCGAGLLSRDCPHGIHQVVTINEPEHEDRRLRRGVYFEHNHSSLKCRTRDESLSRVEVCRETGFAVTCEPNPKVLSGWLQDLQIGQTPSAVSTVFDFAGEWILSSRTFVPS